MNKIQNIALHAKSASRAMSQVSDAMKKKALLAAAEALLRHEPSILAANAKDVKRARAKNLSPALIDRLTLNEKRILGMRDAVVQIAESPDPIGEVVGELTGADGLKIRKVRVPLGVVAMVYESRPNVTVEAAALCLKAGNSVILRGGSEAIHSNKALARIMASAVAAHGIPKASVSFIEDTNRENIYELGSLDSLIDLMIARGSEKMVREIKSRSVVPVLGHGKGVCHVYVDENADLKMAEEIAFNSKVQRPGVCNAAESLLVHKKVAARFLPLVGERYRQAGVSLKSDASARKWIPWSEKATERDWGMEYLDLAMSVKVVGSLKEAVDHINRYGSGHTDVIVTRSGENAKAFLKGVDSAAVFANASTRMHDGGVFGLGAEIGISTQKLHARGTMGLRELTTTKYVAQGSGQVRR